MQTFLLGLGICLLFCNVHVAESLKVKLTNSKGFFFCFLIAEVINLLQGMNQPFLSQRHTKKIAATSRGRRKGYTLRHCSGGRTHSCAGQSGQNPRVTPSRAWQLLLPLITSSFTARTILLLG